MKRFFPYHLHKYIAREFLFWVMGTLGIIAFLIFLLEFSELLRRAHGFTTLSHVTLLGMAFLKVPYLLEDFLPFIIFFASILCLWRLNRYRELIVIRSMGLSVWQFLIPLAFVSLSVGVLDLFVVNPLSSLMKQRYDALDTKYLLQEEYSLKVSDSGIWIRQTTQEGSTIFRFGKIDEERNVFYDLSVYQYSKTHQFVRRVDTQEAHFKDKVLHILKAWVTEDGHSSHLQDTLQVPCDLTFAQLLKTKISPDSMSFWELSRFISLLEKSGLLRAEYNLYWHALISKIFWIASMVFLAATCVLRSSRQGHKSFFVGLCILSGFGLYVLKDVVYVMGAASTIPLLWAAWIPAVMTFITGVTILLFLEDG